MGEWRFRQSRVRFRRRFAPAGGIGAQARCHVAIYCFRIDDLNALATINLGDRNDILREGTPGRDAIRGGPGNDLLVGGAGTDELMQICRSGFVNVTLDGQANDGSAGEGDNVAGDIEIIEGPGHDTGLRFVGNDLPNVVNGGGRPSVLIGGGGDDKLYGGVDNDQIDGGPGNDITEGWGGADTVDGGLHQAQAEAIVRRPFLHMAW
jgi:Ca2+-binding RTX toxin-like protein